MIDFMHAPSPWHCEGQAIIDACGEQVGSVNEGDTVRADGSLLAAAPELLAALEHVCDVFGLINDSVGGKGALIQARAVIAKAKGGA